MRSKMHWRISGVLKLYDIEVERSGEAEETIFGETGRPENKSAYSEDMSTRKIHYNWSTKLVVSIFNFYWNGINIKHYISPEVLRIEKDTEKDENWKTYRLTSRKILKKDPDGVPVLIWWTYHEGKEDGTITCGDLECLVTTDRKWKNLPGIKTYIFYGSSLDLYDLPLPRKSEDVWFLEHEESPKNNDFLFSHEEIMSLFNYTSTFKRESDYPITTQWLPSLDYLQSREYVVPTDEKNRYRTDDRLAPIIYIQSDCDVPSDRDSYVKYLQELIPVGSYGLCENNKKLPEYLSFERDMSAMEHTDFYKLAAKYKFTLAMENAVCDDYITEKVWRPLHLGSVPITFGSPKIKDFLPCNKSSVVIEDFEAITDLVEYVKYLDQNDDAYNEYLQFKESGGLTNQHLVQNMRRREWNEHISLFSTFECFVCRKIHQLQNMSNVTIPFETKVAKIEHYGCPKPKAFDIYGIYTVKDTYHAEPWYYSKYLAQAFRHRYDSNQTFTKESLEHDAKTLRNTDNDYHNENV